MTSLLILPVADHNKSTLKDPSKIQPNPLAEKIYEYAAHLFQYLGPLFLSFRTCDLSQRIYEVIQVSLSTLGCIGYSLTLLLCLGGFIKLALCTALLSTGNFVGAYVAYQTTLLQSLEKSTKEFEKHLAELDQINTELKTTNEDLKETNKELQSQVSLFEKQNKAFRDHIEDLGKISGDLRQEVCDLKAAIQLLRHYNQELKKTAKKLKYEASLFSSQNKQFCALLKEYKKEASQFSSENKSYSYTQAELLKTLENQVNFSDQSWGLIHRQMDHNNATQAAIIEQQIKALTQMRDPELQDALRKDIQQASQEFKMLQAEIRKETAVLEALKKDHQEILALHHKNIKEMSEQNKRLGDFLTALESKK